MPKLITVRLRLDIANRFVAEFISTLRGSVAPMIFPNMHLAYIVEHGNYLWDFRAEGLIGWRATNGTGGVASVSYLFAHPIVNATLSTMLHPNHESTIHSNM